MSMVAARLAWGELPLETDSGGWRTGVDGAPMLASVDDIADLNNPQRLYYLKL